LSRESLGTGSARHIESKVLPMHAMKTCRGNRDTAPPILYFALDGEVSGQVDSPAALPPGAEHSLPTGRASEPISTLRGSENPLAPAESRTTLCQLPSLLMSRSSRQQQSELISVLDDVCRGLTQSVYRIDGTVLRITSGRPVQVMLYHTSLRQRC
jgi:hypothetical protein